MYKEKIGRSWTEPSGISVKMVEGGVECDCRASVVLWLTISLPRWWTPWSIPTSTKQIHDIYGAIWGKILCLAAICAAGWFSCKVVPVHTVMAGLQAALVNRISPLLSTHLFFSEQPRIKVHFFRYYSNRNVDNYVWIYMNVTNICNIQTMWPQETTIGMTFMQAVLIF